MAQPSCRKLDDESTSEQVASLQKGSLEWQLEIALKNKDSNEAQRLSDAIADKKVII